MVDNNPPYFPLSTQAQRIKEALQLDDERLWNALRRKVKAACYAMVDKFRDGQLDRELPTWTEFPNQLLQAAREQVLAEDSRDGAILSRNNGQAALDWLFGTAYNNMKREMARGKPKERQGSPEGVGGAPRSPLVVGHTKDTNLSELGMLPPPSRGEVGGVSGISGQPGITSLNLFDSGILRSTFELPRGGPDASILVRLPPHHPIYQPTGQAGYSQQSNTGRPANEPAHEPTHDPDPSDDDLIQEAVDENGQTYYYNTRTQAASWNRDDPGLRRQ